MRTHSLNITNKAVSLFKLALRETSSPEKTFTVEFTESELVLVVGQLLLCEHHQVILAQSARREGNIRHERARRQSAAKALALADRLDQLAANEAEGKAATK